MELTFLLPLIYIVKFYTILQIYSATSNEYFSIVSFLLGFVFSKTFHIYRCKLCFVFIPISCLDSWDCWKVCHLFTIWIFSSIYCLCSCVFVFDFFFLFFFLVVVWLYQPKYNVHISGLSVHFLHHAAWYWDGWLWAGLLFPPWLLGSGRGRCEQSLRGKICYTTTALQAPWRRGLGILEAMEQPVLCFLVASITRRGRRELALESSVNPSVNASGFPSLALSFDISVWQAPDELVGPLFNNLGLLRAALMLLFTHFREGRFDACLITSAITISSNLIFLYRSCM